MNKDDSIRPLGELDEISGFEKSEDEKWHEYAMSCEQPSLDVLSRAAGYSMNTITNKLTKHGEQPVDVEHWWTNLDNTTRFQLIAKCRFDYADAMMSEAKKRKERKAQEEHHFERANAFIKNIKNEKWGDND